MKLTASVLMILLQAHLSKAAPPAYLKWDLDYVLRAIEHLSAEYHGVFSCVFYDIAPSNPFRNIVGYLLKSPRLSHVVKYVIHGPYGKRIEELPWNPTLLVVNPGDDLKYLVTNKWDIEQVLRLFNPTTKVLVFVKFSNWRMADGITEFITGMKYAYAVFWDVGRMQFRQCNGVHCFSRKEKMNLTELFEYGRRSMGGRNIIYFSNENGMVHPWNMKWVKEVARYLNTVAMHYKHDCEGTGQEYYNCMAKYRHANYMIDIVFSTVTLHKTPTREFKTLYTSIPLFVKILVPRE